MATSEPEPLLTGAELAAWLKVDVKTTSRWARTGKFHTIRTPGGHRRFFENEVRAMLRGEPWELPPEYVNAA
jgi:excisionase family DNA binding protein